MENSRILINCQGKNILEFLKSILEFLIIKETESKNTFKYYTHLEFDSNTTKFESLSNSNKIVLNSNLDDIGIYLVMILFQSIYDENYYKFEDLTEDSIFQIDEMLFPFTRQNLTELEILKNPIQYIVMFYYYNRNIKSEKIVKRKSEYGEIGYIEENYIYLEIPKILEKYDCKQNKDITQKIYTIKDILDLLNSY